MMRKLFIGLIGITWACGLNAQEFKLIESFNYHENSTIQYDIERPYLQKLYSVVEGDFTVFEFRTNNSGDPGNHSEPESIIAFQIPSESESFKLENKEIEEATGVYNQLCRCQDKGISKITAGIITGQRDGENWMIEFEVVAKGRKTNFPYSFKRTAEFKAIEK